MNRLLSIIAVLLFAPSVSFAASISVMPENPIQGDPVMIRVTDLGTTTVKSISLDSRKLGVFSYGGSSAALYGFDINAKAARYSVFAKLSDGSTITKDVVLGARKKVEAPLGIPAKLGGNTKAAATTLVSTLAQENASLLGLRTGDHAFWKEKFGYPVSNPVVTDTFGYSRLTVGTTITHKGTDFHADEGTPVLAMNRGVVRLVQVGRNYGKTIVIDHGLGLMTFYLHLSKILVNEGELVQKGQVIGLSGQTGYADRPHLHLTVRLNDVSVDPVTFLGFFK